MVVDYNITLHYYALHGVSGDRDSWYSNPALLRAHYNYTGRLGDRGTFDDAVNVGISGPRVAALFLCVLIALENALALVVLNRLRAPAYLCLSNLALADLLAATSYGANVALSGERTLQLSPQAWLAREGASFVCLSAAVFGLLAVAGQRGAVAGAVRSARLPRRAVLRRRAVAIMAGCWALALLLGTAPGFGWNCLGDLNECSTVFPLYAKSFVGFCISLLSAVLIAVVVLYLRLYRLVQQSGRRVSVTRRSVSILRTLLVILGVFILCWAPIFILLLTDAASCGRACPALFKADYVIAFAVLNSAINPILAAAASQDIRRAYRSLFCLKRTEEPDSNLPTFTGTRSLSEIGDAHINNVSLDPGNAHNTPGCLKICLLAANRCCLPWLRPSAHPHPAAVTNSQGIGLVLGTPSQCKC